MKTNQCPLVGSCPRCRRTRPDNPSNEQRISVGCVQSQIRPAEIAFNTTGSFALEEPHHPRAPAPHPTTRIGPAQPPRPRQTSIRTVRFAVPYFRAAYVSKDRRYSLTHPVTNRSSCAFDPCVQNAQSISPIRSQSGAGTGSNHSFRSLAHSTPPCTKTSSQSTELHDWNDGLLWPLTFFRSSGERARARHHAHRSTPLLFLAFSRGTPRGFDRTVPVTEFLG